MKLIYTLLSLLFLSSCSSTKPTTGEIKHVVLCWLKQDASPELFIRTVKELKSIPHVKSISTGRKTHSIEPVADNSFDIAFTVTFDSKDKLQSYLQHPLHQQALETVFKPALKKVIVYDYQQD